MHFLIYKITNKINNKIYIGKHITKNLDDNYMGSGKLLRYAFNKYGIENFSKEILFECNSLEELNEREKEIVNQKIVERDDTYNLKVGGDGGWDFCNDPSNGYTSEIRSHKIRDGFALNKSNVGSKNPNYGKHWWKDPNDKTKSLSIKDGDSVPEGWVRGRWQIFSEAVIVAIKETNLKRRGKYVWIYNPSLDIQKLVSSNESLPVGWILGKRPNSDNCKEKLKQHYQRKFNERKDKKYEELKPLYDEYMLNGFKSVKEKFNYKYSIVNLINQFNKYIPEYKNNKKFPKNSSNLSKNFV